MTFHTFKQILKYYILEKSYKAFLFYYEKTKKKVGITTQGSLEVSNKAYQIAEN